MMLQMSESLLRQIHELGEEAYPEEGAGFLLGSTSGTRTAFDVVALTNAREEGARRNRYLIDALDYLRAEQQAEDRGIEVVGVFHSHPDSPNVPSTFDLEWAQPGFSYVITSVQAGKATGSRAWRLAEDRSEFLEEDVKMLDGARKYYNQEGQ
jgi:proteasome lid subunit RPN8/RPN11